MSAGLLPQYADMCKFCSKWQKVAGALATAWLWSLLSQSASVSQELRRRSCLCSKRQQKEGLDLPYPSFLPGHTGEASPGGLPYPLHLASGLACALR